ncbi:MAG: 3-phosphoshikimate 1-carboxyvinyltransferase [Alphaproteobacteria bacterium]|nr:3-phosphoshikimate 1-carboxyvinyltransferase [Alphaproteobacteria bacterium]
MRPLIAHPSGPLEGRFEVPGDKSISHRALILAALAVGPSRLDGLADGDDVRRTALALEALGVPISGSLAEGLVVDGLGVGGLQEPAQPLDFGNSGTGVRLLMGCLATHPFTSHLCGDRSLSGRPMGRIMRPLEEMGASFLARAGDRLPLALIGTAEPLPIAYRLPVPSAQVKSAVLLAALNAPGESSVIESAPSRDHSERLLAARGAEISIEEAGGERIINLLGECELAAGDLEVPGDPSAAAFGLVAGLGPDSQITVNNLCLNPLRTGLFTCLGEMGARLTIEESGTAGGEPVGSVSVAGGGLRGIEVPPERAPAMIDEFPILACAAALAEGTTTMRGLEELRVKESDRLSAIAAGLQAAGVAVEELPDGLIIEGRGRVPGGTTIEVRHDHRIAMAFLVLGLAAEKAIAVDDGGPIATSFPGFNAAMKAVGAKIEGAEGET